MLEVSISNALEVMSVMGKAMSVTGKAMSVLGKAV